MGRKHLLVGEVRRCAAADGRGSWALGGAICPYDIGCAIRETIEVEPQFAPDGSRNSTDETAMAFYRDYIYPHLVHALGNPKPIADIRKCIIPLAYGEV